MSAHVREATVADSAGIARVRIETWRAAYRGLVPQEVLDRLSVERETILRISARCRLSIVEAFSPSSQSKRRSRSRS